MKRARARVVHGLVFIVMLLARQSAGQVLGADFTKGELKCQNGRTTSVGKLFGARLKCITRCLQSARQDAVPFTDCRPPFGGDTADCLRAVAKGAEPKAAAAIEKACSVDCPECYLGGDCSAAAMQAVASAASSIDGLLVPLVYCGMQASLTPGEVKCQDASAKMAGKLVAALGKCVAKCKSSEASGKVPLGACSPPAVDGATVACYSKAQGKSIAAIDKACGEAKPACYPPTPGLLITGFVTSTIDGGYASTYCGG